MRTISCIARLVVLFCLPIWRGYSQEYYTRIPASGGEDVVAVPIIGFPGVSGSTDIQVHPSPNHQSEVSIAVNFCNDINFLAGANVVGTFGYSQGYFYSENSGNTWSGADQLPNIGYYTSDPSVAFDVYNIGNPNGYSNGYFNYLEFVGVSYQLKVGKTTDGGRTWNSSVQIPGAGDPDKNHITTDPTNGPYASNVYVGYTDFSLFPGSPVRVSRSTDLGSSYSVPVNVSGGATSLFSQGVNLAVGPGGEAYAVWAIYDDWNDLDPNSWDEEAIGFARSLNGGASWEPASRILEIDGIRNRWTHKNPQNQVIRVNSFPVIAVDRSGGPYHGTIYLVWANKGTGTDKADIMLSKSTNNGSSWSLPVRVNDDFTTNDQWFPWITVSLLGRVTIVFYDSRVDQPSNQETEVWIAESTDGGTTFTNSRVSDFSFVPVPIPGTATGYMGDYIGITSRDGLAVPAWADNRNGIYQVYVDLHDTYLADLANVANWSRSPVRYATAYGSGRKLLYDGTRWHRLFHVNQYIGYAQSSNDGETWTNTLLMNPTAPGWLSNPSLHYSGGRLFAVMKSDGGLIYTVRGTVDGQWEAPVELREVDGTLTGIASAFDKTGVCHLVYSFRTAGPSGRNYLLYSTFNGGDVHPFLAPPVILAASYGDLGNPSIAVEPLGNQPHVVWESAGEILYRYRTGSTWSATQLVSLTSAPSLFPGLLFNTDRLYLVWQEGTEESSEILMKDKPAGGAWSEAVNVSASAGPSVEPCIVGPVNGEPIVVWADSTAGNFDLSYFLVLSGKRGTFATSPEQSHYPACGVRRFGTGSKVMALCTEGLSSLYEIMSPCVEFQVTSRGVTEPVISQAVRTMDQPKLLRNAPNPFNPSTMIRFELPAAGTVSLKVFDLLGQEVATLVDGFVPAGPHNVRFSGTGFPSGVYFYRLRFNHEVMTGRMILSK